MGKWVMYCVPCGVERSINPSFNLFNWKTHLSLKVNGFDSVHEKNLKFYQNKEISVVKGSRRRREGIGNHEAKRRLSVQICCKR